MRKGTIGRCMVVFAGILLATMTPTSVYADHAATGKGAYAVAFQVLFELDFVVATGGLLFVKSEWTLEGASLSFQSTAIDSFSVADTPDGRAVTITGEMVSTVILGDGPGRQAFAELVPFTATGVDTTTPGAGADHFSLVLGYSAAQAQGPLFASIVGLGACDATTCTVTFAGPMEEGNIFVHTAGGE